MRDVSAAFKSYVIDLESANVLVWLLTLSHNDSIGWRICSYNEDVVSRGETYETSTAELRMPNVSLLRSRTDGRLKIENASRTFVHWLRVECTTTPDITMEFVMLGSPDVVEFGPVDFRAGKITMDDKSITIPLIMHDLFKKPYQSINFDPTRAPALFI